MRPDQHLSVPEFFERLRKRLDRYAEYVGRELSLFRLQMMHAREGIVGKIMELDRTAGIFGGGIWGYGLNSICDGKEKNAEHDIELLIRHGTERNRHNQPSSILWLLIFKIDGDALLLSKFCVDTVRGHVNSDINSRYSLLDFRHARVRTRENVAYVDLEFNGLDSPVYFQIDPRCHPLLPHNLAQYYADQVTKAAGNAKNRMRVSDVPIDLNPELDQVEHGIRNLIGEELFKLKGSNDYKDYFTGDAKRTIGSRIAQHGKTHHGFAEKATKILAVALQFADILDLMKLVLREEHWPRFESHFVSNDLVHKYFDQLNSLRRTVKHGRPLTRIVRGDGESALAWFGAVLEMEKS